MRATEQIERVLEISAPLADACRAYQGYRERRLAGGYALFFTQEVNAGIAILYYADAIHAVVDGDAPHEASPAPAPEGTGEEVAG